MITTIGLLQNTKTVSQMKANASPLIDTKPSEHARVGTDCSGAFDLPLTNEYEPLSVAKNRCNRAP
jgi:hypothetical protein